MQSFEKPYVATWAGVDGPCVQRFEDARSLLSWLVGWCHQGQCVLGVSPMEVRL